MLAMCKIKDTLRLRYEAKYNYRGIVQSLNIGYGTVVDNTTLPTVKAGFILALVSICLLISAQIIAQKEKARQFTIGL